MINAAILGYGTIGSGVVKVLDENREIIARHAGDSIQVSKVLDLRDFPGSPIENILTHDFEDIVNDEDIDIVVEVMGGVRPAYDFVKRCLENCKSVVTSNKALVAAYGPQLLKIAKQNRVNFMFEASVGGGIPVIRPLTRCLTADNILEISGILNGTTNYILTKMYNEGSEFGPSLKEAQDLGYAEADPTADVEGHDSCRKIAILTALANEQFVDFEDIRCEGITGITAADTAFAKATGRKIKLLGTCFKQNGKVYAEVAPVMIAPGHPLYAVDDVMNAIMVKGDMLGNVMFYGAGAGSLPTASAVVSDIIVEAKHLNENVSMTMDPEKMQLGNIFETQSCYYIRVPENYEVSFETEQEIFLEEYPEVKAYITGTMIRPELDGLEPSDYICMKLK